MLVVGRYAMRTRIDLDVLQYQLRVWGRGAAIELIDRSNPELRVEAVQSAGTLIGIGMPIAAEESIALSLDAFKWPGVPVFICPGDFPLTKFGIAWRMGSARDWQRILGRLVRDRAVHPRE